MPSAEEIAVATAQTASDAAAANVTVLKAAEGTDSTVLTAAEEKVTSTATDLNLAKAALSKIEDPSDINKNINDLVTKARQDEKDKMYGKVTKLTEDKKTSDDLVASLQAQLATLAKKPVVDPAESKKSEKDGGKAEPISAEQIQTMLTAQVTKFETEVFQPKLDALTAENNELKQQNSDAKLDSHRKQLIADNNGTIIEEMLIGKTTDELDQSLVTAKQAFAKYNTKAAEAVAKANGSLPPTPDLSGNPSDPNALNSGLSLDDFSKNRDEMLRKAAASVTSSFT